MIKNHVSCFARRWLALPALMLGASVLAGPAAFSQGVSPTGVRGQTLPALAPTQSDLHDAGVVVPGWPVPASEALERDQTAPGSTAAAPQGPVNPSGVVGTAPATNAAPTTSDLIGAGVVHVR
jgi:hypothetical protein